MGREVKLKNGEKIKVEALTGKQVEALEVFGFHMSYFKKPEAEKVSENDIIYSAVSVYLKEPIEKIRKRPAPDTSKIFLAIIAETYGSEEEEKNLSGSGRSDQTPSE